MSLSFVPAYGAEQAVRQRQKTISSGTVQSTEVEGLKNIVNLAGEVAILVGSGKFDFKDPATIELGITAAQWLIKNGPELMENEKWTTWLKTNWQELLDAGSEGAVKRLNEQKNIMAQEHTAKLNKLDELFGKFTKDDLLKHLLKIYKTESFSTEEQHEIMSDFELYRYEAFRDLVCSMSEHENFIKKIDCDSKKVKKAEKFMPENGLSLRTILKTQKWYYGY